MVKDIAKSIWVVADVSSPHPLDIITDPPPPPHFVEYDAYTGLSLPYLDASLQNIT